jgi:hypothetical protein
LPISPEWKEEKAGDGPAFSLSSSPHIFYPFVATLTPSNRIEGNIPPEAG